MAALSMTSVMGTFPASSAIMVGLCSIIVTGTAWEEKANGSTFYLRNTALDGNAVEEILKGKADLNYGSAPSARVVDGVSQGGINESNVPFAKWLFSQTRLSFYKVIAVINKDLIQVESLNGTNPTALDAVIDSGYNVKSLTINVSAGALKMYRYSSFGLTSLTILGVGTFTIPLDIHQQGPVYFGAADDSTISVNPYSAGAIDS